jgi:hypothetical protein
VIVLIVFLVNKPGYATGIPLTPTTISNEQTYLHTDRDVYIAGETMFFKLYVLNSQTQKLSEKSKIAYLLLRSETSNSILKIRVRLISGMAYGSIFLPDTLSTGNYEVVSYTNWMKNFGEKTFFKKEIIIANRFDKDINLHTNNNEAYTQTNPMSDQSVSTSGIQINTEKQTYHQREKVSVSLANKSPGALQPAIVSISVSEETSGITATDFSIDTYLNASKSANSTLQKNNSVSFFPEIKGRIVQGKVINSQTLKGVSDECVLLSCPDTIVNLQYAYTNNKGFFQFLLNDYYDNKELIFSVKDISAKKPLKIEMADEFGMAVPFTAKRFSENTALKSYILRSQDLVYINKTYQLNSVLTENKNLISNPICPRLFYKPVQSVYTDDFIPLTDFADIAREILPTVKVRKHKDTYVADILDSESKMFFNQKPALFLDGVFIDNINQIITFGSDKISKIDVLSTERIFGDLKFPGVIAVYSKNKEIKNINPNQTSLRIQNDSYHPYSRFDEGSIKNSGSGQSPDFRQLLYWNPNFEITNTQKCNFEFYTSDHTGNYVIKIEGITSDGIPISSSFKIQVINQANLSQR